MTRVAIIGDVGGHHAQLVDCLARLGVTATTWPAGLEVIQVGDLFGGVDDVDVARLVEPHLYAGRWRQLIGNWELEAVGGPEVTDTKGRGADRAALEYFARWRAAGLVTYTTTVTSRKGATAIVTHAGVTSNYWRTNLSRHVDAVDVADAINNSVSPTSLWRGGRMFAGHHRLLSPSPVWASTEELWRSWSADQPSPWPQVHGHTHSYNWARHDWRDWVPRELTRDAHPDRRRRHVRYQPAGSQPIIGIDCALNGAPPASLHALELTTAP
jgi:hypothetical protein